MSDELSMFLRNNGVLPALDEEVESANRKRKVLRGIQDEAQSWCNESLRKKEVPEEELGKKHVAVLPSGSFALGTFDPGSDLDLVLLASNHLSRDDLLHGFASAVSTGGLGVRQCQVLALNRCPIVRMTVDEVKVDLSVAVYGRSHLDDDHLSFTGDDHDEREVEPLLGMAEQCIISLNGVRNARAIINSVPDTEMFRSMLSAVKSWSKGRQIYSYPVGYLGGAAWSVMVAHVCRKHHGLNETLMLKKFFEVFSDWPWPKPLLLRELTEGWSGFHPWNPKDDYRHLMPIIQPCHPEVNCAFNVNALTKSTLTEELKRGRSILHRVYEAGSELLRLFEPFQLFRTFGSGLVESRIRFLLGDLSKVTSVRHAAGEGQALTKWYVGLEVSSSEGGGRARLDVTREIDKFKSLVYNRATEYGWNGHGKQVEVVSLGKEKGDFNGDLVKDYLPEWVEDSRLVRHH